MVKRRVCVIGAGVIGLSSALRLLEELEQQVDVTLISEEFSPFTTGDGSAGWVRPYLAGNTPTHLISRWCSETRDHLMKISRTEDGGRLGVYTSSGYDITKIPRELPAWKDLVLNFRDMTSEELAQFPGYRYGYAYTTMQAECKKYLPWILQRFLAAGGRCIQRKVGDLAELYGQYDIVVNCTGIGAKKLVNDKNMHSIKGQVIRVEALWVKHFVNAEDDDLYILPSCESVTLGGTHEEDVDHKEPNKPQRQRIWEGCCALVPSLKKGRVVEEWAGFRPGRSSIRLERELYQLSGGRNIPVVHNYGHGGSGVTLHWGCAGDTVQLVREILNTSLPATTTSKL